jgi:hypothetical protein
VPCHWTSRWRLLLVSAALLLTTGCSRDLLPVGHDPAPAREALVAALEAWKAGQAGKLKTGNPPLRFVDDDWVEGKVLVGYELANPKAQFLPFENLPVELELRDRSGRTFRKSALYQVTLQPHRAVLRADQ